MIAGRLLKLMLAACDGFIWCLEGGPQRAVRWVWCCFAGHEPGAWAPGYISTCWRVCRRCDGVVCAGR